MMLRTDDTCGHSTTGRGCCGLVGHVTCSLSSQVTRQTQSYETTAFLFCRTAAAYICLTIMAAVYASTSARWDAMGPANTGLVYIRR